jgi:hypothetical protein
MGIAASWTHDCNGKQDFDGPIIEISTRYWPRGGGFMGFDTATCRFEENEDRPEIKPSAHSAIVLRDIEEDHDRTIAESDFEAETEAEVKRQVEEWANAQRQRIIAALDREFHFHLT